MSSGVVVARALIAGTSSRAHRGRHEARGRGRGARSMNGTSVLGGAFLLVVGIGFLAAALAAWSRRNDADRPSSTSAVVIDVLVGGVAVVDAGLSVVDEPARAVLWWCGSAVLVAALVLLAARHHGATAHGGRATVGVLASAASGR